MGSKEQAQRSLAMNGGTRARTQPWPARGLLGAEEKAAVDALFDESIQTGRAFGYNGEPEESYCRQFAALMGGGFADAVNSGTSAVYVALRALEPSPYSECIVGPVTDPGGIMPIPLMNCIPMVADAAPGTFAPGPEQIEACITPRTSAILVAHILGEPADMHGIMAAARRHGLPVVEDAAQAHGATIAGRPVGTFGDLAAFSTMFGKHYCTGGQGGIVYTRSEERASACRRISDRGKPFGLPEGRTNVVASHNLNLNDLAAAIGTVQLSRLPEIVARRRAVVKAVTEGIRGLRTIGLPRLVPGADPSYWLWRLELKRENLAVDRDTYCRALAAEGVEFFPRYNHMPHTYEWFTTRNVFGRPGLPWSSAEYTGDRDRQFPCPNAHTAVERCIALTVMESWTEREANDIVTAFTKLERAFAKESS
jgi:perosamine synthetase